MTTLSLAAAPAPGTTAPAVTADALVVGLLEGAAGPVPAPGSEALLVGDTGAALLGALQGLGATGRSGEVTRVATLGALPQPLLVAVGLGPVTDAHDSERVRRAQGDAVRALAGSTRVATALSLLGDVRAVAEGSLLGAYSFTAFRSSASTAQLKPPVGEVVLLVADPADAAATTAVRRAQVVGDAVRLARDLVNTPPSHLRPEQLAEAAREHCSAAGLLVEVYDEQALRDGGYGGVLGVGQGSDAPPRLVHVRHRGAPTGSTAPSVALVGKGITFDSGGLSLKPAAAMEEMKIDMGGAAAVLATMIAAAGLELPVDVDAWVPMAENMPSGTAIRPSDVLTMRGGKRVEVNNTDAEGRLILADAIVRACEDSPGVLLDVATLTGAQLVALGARTAGVMANDDALRAQVVDAAGRAGESVWGMPLPADLRKGLDSEVADLVNTGPREGGMLTAGLFLQEFVGEGVRWAHVDIAGPAYNSGEAYGYTPHGATGASVRTFVQVLEDLAAS